MITPSVYLAGPITGKSYNDATSWRDEVSSIMRSHGIECFSPLRTKVYLSDTTNIEDCYNETTLSSQRGIYARDYYDCRSKDALFVNLLDTDRVSIGTVMEIAWAVAYNKPIVLVMEKTGNLHDHAMIREACPFIAHSIEEGIIIMKSILLARG